MAINPVNVPASVSHGLRFQTRSSHQPRHTHTIKSIDAIEICVAQNKATDTPVMDECGRGSAKAEDVVRGEERRAVGVNATRCSEAARPLSTTMTPNIEKFFTKSPARSILRPWFRRFQTVQSFQLGQNPWLVAVAPREPRRNFVSTYDLGAEPCQRNQGFKVRHNPVENWTRMAHNRLRTTLPPRCVLAHPFTSLLPAAWSILPEEMSLARRFKLKLEDAGSARPPIAVRL